MLRPIFPLTAILVLCACSGDETTPANASSAGGGGTTSSSTGQSGGTGPSSGTGQSSTATGAGGCDAASPCPGGEACHDGVCQPIVCGDGVVDEGEECDDGSGNADDAACTSACLAAACGDGHVWAGMEDCDDGAANADDAACTSACAPAACGDGLVWTGHEECDDGNQTLDDTCPDGPGGTCKWNLPPDPASGLGWQESSPSNTTTPTAIWTPSASADVVSQELQLFGDATCTAAIGGPVAAAAIDTASMTLSVGGEGSYTFQITTTDGDGKQSTSACSPVMVVDTTPPLPATSLGYLETSPHDTLTVHGTWVLSPSPDLGAQQVQLYGGGACTVPVGAPMDVGSATAEVYPIVTPTNATYSFKVISIDQAGNTSTSTCSPPMQTIGGQPYVATFNGNLAQLVIQVRVDPKNASTMYATLSSGRIYKSVDSGASWTLQCTSSNIAQFGTNYGHIVVSPGLDGTAYATGHTQFARVEPLAGAECPVVIDSSAAWASYFHSNRLAIDSTGKIYTWTFIGPGGLVSSVDHGASYTVLNATESLFNSMSVDPFNNAHLVGVFAQHVSDPVGIWHSLNAGVTWTQTDATFEGYEGGVIFNPAAQGWIYLVGGRYSQDGGLTWATNAAYDVLEVDATGAGYRLVTSGNDIELDRAPNMTAPVWSTLHTFAGVQADLTRSMVSVKGSTIAVVLEGRLFVSTNGGNTFNQIDIVVANGPLVASSIVAHDSLLYAAANGRIFQSTNAAQSWSEVYAPSNPIDQSTELHLNPGTPAQLIARPETWNSTYEERLDLTLDGGLSWATPANCCYSWAGVLALGPADPSRVYYFGWEPRVSYDGGLSFAPSGSSGPLVWYPWPQAFVNPSNSDQAFYGSDSGDLYRYDVVTDNDTNLTNLLPFSDAAGIDIALVGGNWQLRIISRTGQIAISEDDGATFTLVPGSGGLPSENQRIFVSHHGDPNLIATAPLLGGDVAYSPTLGATWVQTTVNNCNIRGLALTDGQLFIPCENAPALAIAAP